MAKKVYVIDSNQAQYTAEELSALLKFACLPGVFNINATNSDLKVVQHAAGANMSVDIGLGGALINYTKNGITWNVIAVSNAVDNNVIAANSSGSNRVDAIVIHLTQTTPNQLKNNVAETLTVLGTGTSPLSDGDITAAVGDSNWYRLANITVPNAASSIVTGNISDTRSAITIGNNTGGYATILAGNAVHTPFTGAIDAAGYAINNTGSVIPIDDGTSGYFGTSSKRAKEVRAIDIYATTFHGSASGLTNIPGVTFGGDGTDGALSITSGTTTINLGGAAVVTKNYTSISITGTGTLAFSNPHANGTIIILKSQGNVTLTSSSAPMIDASGMGAAAGAAVTANGASNPGNNGTIGYAGVFGTGPGLAGTVTNTTLAGGVITQTVQRLSADTMKYYQMFMGGGGASGAAQDQTAAATATSGAGGRGGPVLIIECGGALNFTTASGISVRGKDGGNGTYAGTRGFAQGGSPGAGGICFLFYNSLTAASGTILSTAGSVGTGQIVIGAGTSDNTGPSGAASGVGAGTGTTHSGTNVVAAPGASADGLSIIAKNTLY